MRTVSVGGALGVLVAYAKEFAGFGGPSIEDFRLELAELGLVGRAFGPLDYARALEGLLGIRITVEEVPDLRLAFVRREILREGTLAEVFYKEECGEALILVRESLRMRPWPTYELALYHELSHLAAGHTMRPKEQAQLRRRRKALGIRPAASEVAHRRAAVYGCAEGPEEPGEHVHEIEAKRRARWLLLAGTHPEVFEGEGVDRLT